MRAWHGIYSDILSSGESCASVGCGEQVSNDFRYVNSMEMNIEVGGIQSASLEMEHEILHCF